MFWYWYILCNCSWPSLQMHWVLQLFHNPYILYDIQIYIYICIIYHISYIIYHVCVCFLNFFIDGCWWKHHPRLAGASRWILEWGFRRIFLQLSCKGWNTLYFDAFQCSWLMAIVASQLIAGQYHARTHTTALHCTFGTTVRKYSTNLPSTSYDLISKMHDLHLLYLEALPCAQAPLNYAELARAFPITSRTTTKSSHVHPCTAPRTNCNKKATKNESHAPPRLPAPKCSQITHRVEAARMELNSCSGFSLEWMVFGVFG